MGNTAYIVENTWGGSSTPHPGGVFVIGARPGQNVVEIDVRAVDGGTTLSGTMTYAGEGPIGFSGTLLGGNNYDVKNSWGDSGWQPGGTFVLGCRAGQNVVALKASSNDGGKTLKGTMTYAGEGPIGFSGTQSPAGVYATENTWGGSSFPHPGGTFVFGCRADQNVVAIDVSSKDGGNTLSGSMTYAGEGPIDFRGTRLGLDNYVVENKWGSSDWQPGGTFIIGYRDTQTVVALNVTSDDDGNTLSGKLTYAGEGPIGFQGTLQGAGVPAAA